MCPASFSGARARHPQQPSTDELGPDSLESLALIANRFLSSQQGIAQQKLKDAQAVADNSSLGHKDAAAALAQINSNWFEKMRQAYEDTNNELIKVVITLSPRQADLAVTLWKGHMVIQTTLMDGFVCVFQAAVKGFLEKIGPVVEVLKKAYQMIKDILVLARQKTQKVFGGEPTVLPHSDKLPKGLEEDTK